LASSKTGISFATTKIRGGTEYGYFLTHTLAEWVDMIWAIRLLAILHRLDPVQSSKVAATTEADS